MHLFIEPSKAFRESVGSKPGEIIRKPRFVFETEAAAVLKVTKKKLNTLRRQGKIKPCGEDPYGFAYLTDDLVTVLTQTATVRL